MDRKELLEKVKFQWDNPNGVEDLADFILDNFQPKQSETVSETVTAKEVFLALMANSALSRLSWIQLSQKANIAAEAFNNSLNPESHE